MIETRTRSSILGSLALLAGAAGIVLKLLKVGGLAAVTVGPVHLTLPAIIACGALLLALIALLAAASSRRTSTAIPLMAILVAATAVVWSIYGGGISGGLFSHGAPKPAVSPQTAEPPSQTVSQQASPATEPSDHARSIFDDGIRDSERSVASGSAPGAADSPATEPAPQRTAMVNAARAKLDAARASVMRSLESSASYRAAKAEDDAAQAELKRARREYAPGSPELVGASQAALEAHNKVQSLISDAMAADPAVAEAQHELQAQATRER